MLKTVIFSLQVSFAIDFVSDCAFTLSVNSNFDTAFSVTVPNFVVFFRLLDKKCNEDSRNVLKIVIFLLQVGFIDDFVPDCSFLNCFWQFKL